MFILWGLTRWHSGKNPPANVGNTKHSGLIPGVERSPGVGNGNPLQYSCLGNSTGRGACLASAHGVAKSQTWLSNWAHTHINFTHGNVHISVLLSQFIPLYSPSVSTSAFSTAFSADMWGICKGKDHVYSLWRTVISSNWLWPWNVVRTQTIIVEWDSVDESKGWDQLLICCLC